MAGNRRTFEVQFLGDVDQLKKSLKAIEGDTARSGKSLSQMGKAAKAAMAGVAASAAFKFGRELRDMAVLSEGVGNRVETVFGEMADAVRDWAEEQAEAFGTSTDGVLQMAAELGDLLIPMGFTRREAAEMTTEVLEAANALSEWTGGATDTATAAEAVTKAMLGERDMLKQLGISLLETDISSRLAAKGQDELTGKALEQAKAVATQELVFEKSADALAAYAGEGNKALKDQKALTAQIEEQKQALATRLLPAIQGATDGAVSLAKGVEVVTDWLDGLPGPVKAAAVGLGALGAALKLAAANPVIAALGVVAGLVAAIGEEARRSEALVEGLADALADTGYTLERFIELQAEAASQGGLWDQATSTYSNVDDHLQRVGLTAGDVANQLRGGRDATDEWAAGFESSARASGNWSRDTEESLNVVINFVEALREAWAEQHKEELEERDKARHSVRRYNREALTPMEEQLLAIERANREALTTHQEYRNALRETVDPAFRLMEAQRRYTDATLELNRLQADGKIGTGEWQQAVEDAWLAELDLADAQAGLVEAGGDWEQALRDTLAALGLQNDEIERYISLAKQAQDIGPPGYVGAGTTTSTVERNATGGPVTGHTPTIVGEEGPEVFVPGTAGTIIPNHRLGGGAVQYVEEHIHVLVDGHQLAEAVRRYERGVR